MEEKDLVKKKTLKDLEIGKTATIVSVGGEGALRQHFLDMGVIPEAEVTMIKYAPMGDPVELRIHGYELTLRLADAEKIIIDDIREKENGEAADITDASYQKNIFHPGPVSYTHLDVYKRQACFSDKNNF